MISRGTIFNKN